MKSVLSRLRRVMALVELTRFSFLKRTRSGQTSVTEEHVVEQIMTDRDILLVEILAEVRQGRIREDAGVQSSKELALLGRFVPSVP